MREKLIRDQIPSLALAGGRSLITRTASELEFDRLLGLKLVEEVHEVIDALASAPRGRLIDELADLQTVVEEVARRRGIALEEIEQRIEDKRAERGGFEAGIVLREHGFTNTRLHVGGGDTLVEALRRELQACKTARLAVAFVLSSGVDLLEGAIRGALLRGAEVKLLTTDYLGVTEPDALERMFNWQGHFDARIYSHDRRSFHPKAYLFERADGSGRAFVGSANLSRSGLREGVEWTWTVLDVDVGQPMYELQSRFDEIFNCEDSKPLSPTWVDAYRACRQVRPFVEPPEPAATSGDNPREVQILALQELDRLRADGQTKALVVAATGLGKTYLAAFDAHDAQRVLFIAHREELLRQAASAFSALYPGRSQGFVSDGKVEYDRDCVFASIQTLSRPEQLSREDLRRFDYVVIDEFHHAAADSYQRVMSRLSPRFLLGLTATPFRGDNRDLLELCDGNLAYQVGLFEAIGFGWLVPFRYFGVADTVVYTDELLTTQRTYDKTKLTARYNSEERASLVVDRFQRHASEAALGFCVSIENAEFMAERFRAAGIPSAAVHSAVSSMDRVEAVQKLKTRELHVLFTVDMFNEGVDIPVVDLVMFLRPTESMTIFLQQLGRGLRLHDGKAHLTVLDFIGNYRNAHFKLPFLAGQDLSQDIDPTKAFHVVSLWQETRQAPRGMPEGITVEMEPIALAALKAVLQSATPQRQLVLADLEQMAERLGRGPTALEWQQLGRYSLAAATKVIGVDRWNRVLETAGLLDEAGKAMEYAAGEFLKELERSPMTKSFKMVVVLAMCKGGSFRTRISLSELIKYFRSYFREERHCSDVLGTIVEAVETVSSDIWRSYLLANPIKAWSGGNTATKSPYFLSDTSLDEFRYIGPHAGYDATSQRLFGLAILERAQARLHAYWQRPGPGRLVYAVIPTGDSAEAGKATGKRSVCIMFGNERAELPHGWHLVLINGEYLYGKFVQVALNVLKRSPSDERAEPNELTDKLKALFGGRFPPRPRVRFVKLAGSPVWEIRIA